MEDTLILKTGESFTSGRAKSIVQLKARQMANTLESVPFAITGVKTTNILKNSGFKLVRRKLGKILSKYGLGAVITLPVGQTFATDAVEVFDYTMVGQVELDVQIVAGQLYMVNGQEYPVITQFHFVNNTPAVDRYVQVPEFNEKGEPIPGTLENIPTQETYIYKGMTKLPVEVFWNNEDRLSDVDYAMQRPALVELNEYDGQKMAEWRRTRTQPYYNTNFTDLEGKTHTDKIDKGQGYTQEDGYSSKVGAGYQMLPATGGTAVLQQQMLFLEDDIYKKLMMKRDTDANGTNKHGLEIILKDEIAIDEIISMQHIREDHWVSFFAKLEQITKEHQEIVLELSPVVKGKISYFEDTIAEEQSKSSVADPLKSTTETVEKD